MSLRAEYSWEAKYSEERDGWKVRVFHQPHDRLPPRGVGESWAWNKGEREVVADRLIKQHMERVTRMLDTPAEPSEEADHLAHRGDQQQQEDADHGN